MPQDYSNTPLPQPTKVVVVSVSYEDTDKLAKPWMTIQYPLPSPIELPIRARNYPPREEPYRFVLNVMSTAGSPLSQSTALLRVLTEEQGRSLARQDRLENKIYKFTAQTPTSKDKEESGGTAQSSNAVQTPQAQAQQDPPSPAQQQEQEQPAHTVPRPHLTKPSPGASGFLPPGWWTAILPANIIQTDWDYVQKTWKNGGISNWIEEIKVAGYNVIHPVNGSSASQIPFDARLRWHISRAADGHDISVLYDVDYKSPGHSFKEYYGENNGGEQEYIGPGKGNEDGKRGERDLEKERDLKAGDTLSHSNSGSDSNENPESDDEAREKWRGGVEEGTDVGAGGHAKVVRADGEFGKRSGGGEVEYSERSDSDSDDSSGSDGIWGRLWKVPFGMGGGRRADGGVGKEDGDGAVKGRKMKVLRTRNLGLAVRWLDECKRSCGCEVCGCDPCGCGVRE